MTTGEVIHAEELRKFTQSGVQRTYGIQEFGGDPAVPVAAGDVRPIHRAYACVRPLVTEGARVIEIGSGGGRWTKALADLGASVIAVDGTDATWTAMLHPFAGKPPLTVICKDGRLSPLLGPVDGVFSYDTLVHMPPLVLFNYLRSLPALVRPGGWVAIHWGTPYYEVAKWRPEPSGAWSYYPRGVVEREMHALGFAQTHLMEISDGYGSTFATYTRDNHHGADS